MTPKRMLIIDDESIVREVLQDFLVLLGYAVDQVDNGVDGLQKIKENNYLAVFTDLRMPGMNGVEVTRTLQLTHPALPVIIITGQGYDETLEEAVNTGARGVLKKPFSFDRIQDVIKDIDCP